MRKLLMVAVLAVATTCGSADDLAPKANAANSAAPAEKPKGDNGIGKAGKADPASAKAAKGGENVVADDAEPAGSEAESEFAVPIADTVTGAEAHAALESGVGLLKIGLALLALAMLGLIGALAFWVGPKLSSLSHSLAALKAASGSGRNGLVSQPGSQSPQQSDHRRIGEIEVVMTRLGNRLDQLELAKRDDSRLSAAETYVRREVSAPAASPVAVPPSDPWQTPSQPAFSSQPFAPEPPPPARPDTSRYTDIAMAVAQQMPSEDYEDLLRRHGTLRNVNVREGEIYVEDRYDEHRPYEILAILTRDGNALLAPTEHYYRSFAGNSNVLTAPQSVRTAYDLIQTDESELRIDAVTIGSCDATGRFTPTGGKGRLTGFTG